MTVVYNGNDLFTIHYEHTSMLMTRGLIEEIKTFNFDTMKSEDKTVEELNEDIVTLNRELDNLEAELESLREELYG